MSVSSSLWRSPFLAPRLGWKMAILMCLIQCVKQRQTPKLFRESCPPLIDTYRTVERSAALAACLASSLAAWAAHSALSAFSAL